jgi:hypothetical protein
MKKLIIALATVATLLVYAPLPAGATGWAKWSNSSSPAFNKMDATYKLIGTALTNNAVAQAESLFQTYSNEVVAFAGNDNSPNKTINQDVRVLSYLSNEWSWIGYTTIVNNSPLTAWNNINAQLRSELTRFTNDLTTYRG